MAQIVLAKGASPNTPSNGKVSLFVKNDGTLSVKTDEGVESPLMVDRGQYEPVDLNILRTSNIGVNVQQFDADLDAIASISTTGLIERTGIGAAGTVAITAAGKAILDDSDNTQQRITLGLGNSSTLDVGTGSGTVAAGDHSHTFSSITSKPTTLSGYGITDAILSSARGAANGVASLGSDGLVPANQLPSYVDDVLEYASLAGFPATGETGKIYVAIDNGKIYRWSGTVYIEISPTAGNADSATKLATSRTISLAGDVTGSVGFDGTADVSITTVVADDSHQHAFSNLTGKPTTLAGYGITDAVPVTSYTAADVLSKIKTVDGAGSDLDADLLDGKHASEFATASQGAKADSALQSSAIGSTVCSQTDSRLGDSREWTATTVAQAEAEAGTATTRRAWTAQRVFQAIGAWWNASAAKSKLDGIATGATANATDAQLRDRATHTGTQAVATITGLGGAATLNVGTSAGTVCAGNDSRLSDARTPTAHTHTATNISDSTPAGRALLTAADAAAQRTALDLVKQASATDVTPGRVALVDYVQLRTPVNDIGVAGQAGFGVGVYEGDLAALGLTPLPGYNDPFSFNYGNYVHAGGSVVVFVPQFYLRVGSAESPRYAAYGTNAHDVAPAADFAGEAAANAAGYFLHRAFKDGGAVKSGYFVDKYIASKDASGLAAVSVRNAAPISLTTDAAYTNSSGMPGCDGRLYDAVTLARARGPGWACNSIFIWDALAKLSLAHAQAAAATANCAWYDASGTANYPRGCNNNALADANDAAVTWVSAGDAGAAAKGQTGSATPFASSTHNGQPSGIADLNGLMWECMLGLTNPASSASDGARILNGDAWVLRESVALADLTAGFGAGNDAWGGAPHLADLYDFYEDFFPWGDAEGWVRFGNGGEQVFSSDVAGIEYLRACCGVSSSVAGFSAAGSNAFGADGNYRYNRANLFPLAGAFWLNGSDAGVWARAWHSNRSNANGTVGFRAAAYGS